MKKTAIALAVALAGFATVAQAAPKDNTKRTNTWALKWDMTGLAVCLTKAA
jgi:hypothetical protein